MFNSKVLESHREPASGLTEGLTRHGSEGIAHLLDHRAGVLARGRSAERGERAWESAKIFPAISSHDCHNSSWEVGRSAILILLI